MSNSRETNPFQNLFSDIKKILDFMEVKNLSEAKHYETEESKNAAEMWMNAKEEKDTFITYKMFWDFSMFQEVVSNVRKKDVKFWLENPYQVPILFHENLLKRGREKFFRQYEELNDYYRMLNGMPPVGTPESEFIYLSEPMRNQLHTSTDPVHLLSPLIQNSYMNTEEYQKIIQENPDKKYLKYLGLYKIDPYLARKARDFEIIRYPLNRSNINPNVLKEFSELWRDYREYVVQVLYNEQLESIYVNYRSFLQLILQCFVILQLCNRGIESIHDRNYLDDTILHTILSMYQIPDTLIMTTQVRRNLAINLLQLTREKGTDDIYYDLVRILEYQDVIISKLLLMKGPQYDPNKDYEATDEVDPYFVQVELNDPNPYETIVSGKAPTYSYKEIIDQDPTWWDLPDVRRILRDQKYSYCDSKYIVLEAVIDQMKYIFESIYFARMILDNKQATESFEMEIPELFGTEKMSIFDLMIFLIAATCMNNGMSGELYNEHQELLAVAGFNFNMDLDSFTEYVNTTKYLDKERVMGFMENLTVKTPEDINRIFHDVMCPMREWLEQKIAKAENKYEYIEYESIYRALYTYDATENSIIHDFQLPLNVIQEKYGLSDDDLIAFQNFYPHTYSGHAVTVTEYKNSNYYYPFLSNALPVTYYIHIIIETPYGEDDRGYLYFYDILNSDDIRNITNDDGTRVFMDYEDDEIGWEINVQAVDKAIEMIQSLPEDQLSSAYFQIQTPTRNQNRRVYQQFELLPAILRSGIYRDLMIDKIRMDAQGLALPPDTYQEYLYRKNSTLYNLLVGGNRFTKDRDAWLNDVLTIVSALESYLSIHVKYFEQSVVGSDRFFKPLITLINHFKSKFVRFAKSGLKYVFGDKMDAGGNSNMFKLFDEIDFIIHFVTLKNQGYESQFGLYDTIHRIIHNIEPKESVFGFVDEVKFFTNGEETDPNGHPSMWYTGEPGGGRWENSTKIHFRLNKHAVEVDHYPVDYDGWKDYLISYSPNNERKEL